MVFTSQHFWNVDKIVPGNTVQQLNRGDGDTVFLWNVGTYQRVYVAPKPTAVKTSTLMKLLWFMVHMMLPNK